MRRLSACLLLGLGFAFVPATVRGQNVALQQPAFRTFGAGTTVSAPDRGRVAIGGVNRGANSGGYQGLMPAGSRFGGESSAAGADAGVWIHDLEDLDRQVLSKAAARTAGPVKLPGYAGTAWNQLHEASPGEDLPTSSRQPVENAELARSSGKLLKEGLAAEERGRRKLALAFYRVAAQQGSKEAGEQLRRLERPGRMAKATNPAEEAPQPGSSSHSRALGVPGGFEAKSNPKRSGSAR